MTEKGILGFDPLSINSEFGGLDSSIAQDAVRREVLNILKSYTGYYDIFAELVQNALDALDHKAKQGAYKPQIWISIDIENSKIRVVDNGIGMTLPEARFCFRPNVSFKMRKMSRGHKGVGATFIAYGFSTVRLFTKKDGQIILGSCAMDVNGQRIILTPSRDLRSKQLRYKLKNLKVKHLVHVSRSLLESDKDLS